MILFGLVSTSTLITTIFSGADGILFNSSRHTGEQNVVLFEQNKVECTSVAKHRITNIIIEARTII